MTGMTDLDAMLRNLTVRQREGAYVFAVVATLEDALALEPAATITEDEGVTVVVDQRAADRAGLDYDYVAAWLTLEIHSALEAVGLTAAFARVLADVGISANVLAGRFHDHLLVPLDEAPRAVDALAGLRRSQ